MMEPLTALAAPVNLGAAGVVVDFPGTATLELTGLGEPVPTATTGVTVGVKVMVETMVVGTQVVTVMTELLKGATGKGATAGTEELTALTGAGATGTEVTAAGTEVARAGQLVTEGAQEVMVSTS